METPGVMDVLISEIGESYGSLRLFNPRSAGLMVQSLGQYGQLSPVVVGPRENGRHELVDGFKRLFAGRRLGYTALKARVLSSGARGLKAAMIQLNQVHHSLGDLDEALVVQSLYRDECLSQPEIAVLLGRHKSWVSRRITMIERLSEEVLNHLRLGLIKISVGRELSKLPRGNQEQALKTVLKYRLTCRESALLVHMAHSRPRWDLEAILSFPQEILDDRRPPRPRNFKIPEAVAAMIKTLAAMKKQVRSVWSRLGPDVLARLTEEHGRNISGLIQEVEQELAELKKSLNEPHDAALY